jgi:hypothetical protein
MTGESFSYPLCFFHAIYEGNVMEQRYPGSASIVSTAKREERKSKGKLEDRMGLALIMLRVFIPMYLLYIAVQC